MSGQADDGYADIGHRAIALKFEHGLYEEALTIYKKHDQHMIAIMSPSIVDLEQTC